MCPQLFCDNTKYRLQKLSAESLASNWHGFDTEKSISHREKSISNLAKLNQIWIIFTIFRLILHQIGFSFIAVNQSEKCNNNQILVKFNKIQSFEFSAIQIRAPKTCKI